jgi:dipeptide/tripeptide permease
VNTQITVALITAAAGILAAAITFFLTKSKERSAQLQQRKQTQYQELLSAISDLADQSVSLEQATKRFAVAVNTIVLVAPQPVIDALMAYYLDLSNKTPDRRRRVELLNHLILEIRKSLELPFTDDPKTFHFELVAVTKGQASGSPSSPSTRNSIAVE